MSPISTLLVPSLFIAQTADESFFENRKVSTCRPSSPTPRCPLSWQGCGSALPHTSVMPVSIQVPWSILPVAICRRRAGSGRVCGGKERGGHPGVVLGDPDSTVWGGSPRRAPGLLHPWSRVGCPLPRVLLLLAGGAPKRHSPARGEVTLLCLHRDASPADLLPASAAEFPGLIPRSGSSLTLSSRQLRCKEARLSTQASWSLRHGGCDPLAAAAGPDLLPTRLQEGTQHLPAWGSCSASCLVPPALPQPSCGIPFPSPVLAVPHPRAPSASSRCRVAPRARARSSHLSRSLGRAGSMVAAAHQASSQCSLLQRWCWGRFITLAEGLRASWCLGCFQGFQSLLKFFSAHPPVQYMGFGFLEPGPSC